MTWWPAYLSDPVPTKPIREVPGCSVPPIGQIVDRAGTLDAAIQTTVGEEQFVLLWARDRSPIKRGDSWEFTRTPLDAVKLQAFFAACGLSYRAAVDSGDD